MPMLLAQSAGATSSSVKSNGILTNCLCPGDWKDVTNRGTKTKQERRNKWAKIESLKYKRDSPFFLDNGPDGTGIKNGPSLVRDHGKSVRLL